MPELSVAENEDMPFAKRRELEVFGESEDRPYREDERQFYSTLSGYEGKGFVNTHLMRHGEDARAAEAG